MNPHFRPRPLHRLQRGAVLFIALIFLILLVLLGLTASGSAVMQEGMTGGVRSGQMALMGAESALRGAEFNLWIAAQTSAAGNKLTLYCSYDGSGGCYMPDGSNNFSPTTSAFATAATWAASPSGGTTYAPLLTGQTGSSTSANIAAQPQYLVRMLGPDLPPGSTGSAGGSLLQQNGGSNNQTKYIYSVTARSPGGNANTLRVAQSTFASIKPSY